MAVSRLNPAQFVLLVASVLTLAVSVGGACSVSNDELNYSVTVSLSEGHYCFVNECTIRINDSNLLLIIINSTGDLIMATNTINLFIAPNNGTNCTSEHEDNLDDPEVGFFIFFVIVSVFIVISSFANVLLHVVIKELRTVLGRIIIVICCTIIITFSFTLITAVFQYVQRVNGNSSICASLKYIVTAFTLLYTIIKTVYLFHFGYLMYRSFKSLSHKENDQKLLYLYGAIFIGSGLLCTCVVIVIDVVNEKTVFETHRGYCADFFRNPGTSDKVLIAMLALLTVIEIIFFVVAISLYYLTTKQFCACGTGPSDVRVSITLISAIGLNASLLVILLLAGVEGESSVVAASVATCVEQLTLLFVFLTSKKVQAKMHKYLEKKQPKDIEKGMPLLLKVTAVQ